MKQEFDSNSPFRNDPFFLFKTRFHKYFTEAPEFGLANSEPKYCFRRGQKNFLPPLFITFLDVSDLPESKKRRKKNQVLLSGGWWMVDVCQHDNSRKKARIDFRFSLFFISF